MFTRFFLSFAFLVLAVIGGPALADATPWHQYSETKTAAWQQYSDAKTAAWQQYSDAKLEKFKVYQAFELAELKKLRDEHYGHYLLLLDAERMQDGRKAMALEKVPAIAAFKKTVASKYAEYQTQTASLYSEYEKAVASSYKKYEEATETAYKVYQAKLK